MTTAPERCWNHIENWLDNIPCDLRYAPEPCAEPSTPLTPPPSLLPQSSTDRKRKCEMQGQRSASPTKRRRTEEEITPDQSASVVAATELSERTTLSHRSRSAISSPKRGTSPVRDLLNDLRASKPAILCELPFTVDIPESVSKLQKAITEDLGKHIIPMGLRVC